MKTPDPGANTRPDTLHRCAMQGAFPYRAAMMAALGDLVLPCLVLAGLGAGWFAMAWQLLRA